MAWRPEVFYKAFARSGLLCPAVYQPAGVATPFQVFLQRPDVLALGGDQQVPDIEIEYETAAVPALRRGDLVSVTDLQGITTLYAARAHAARLGDGWFSRCQLDKA